MTLVKMYTILPLFLLTLTLPTQAERFTVTVRTVSFVSSNMIKPLIFIPMVKMIQLYYQQMIMLEFYC